MSSVTLVFDKQYDADVVKSGLEPEENDEEDMSLKCLLAEKKPAEKDEEKEKKEQVDSNSEKKDTSAEAYHAPGMSQFF